MLDQPNSAFDLQSCASLSLPNWMADLLSGPLPEFDEEEDRVRFVLDLSRANVAASSGGPFAAAVYTRDSHHLIGAGVNRVVSERSSLAHGEIMAILMAQAALRTHDLAAPGLPAMELVTSAQPCIQCYGAIIWSGIRHVVVCARSSDVESIVGFDEGPLPSDWVKQWRRRGITVKTDVMREQACAVLKRYRDEGHPVYNSGSNPLANM